MIPADVASSLRLLLPNQQGLTDRLASTQAALPAQRVIDALGDLTPGQRLFAEVQAALPNGAYRTLIAQREVVLSLPFSAKPGDSLELEVVDSEQGLMLTVTGRHTQPEAGANNSVATSLSRTGQLIGDLLNGIDTPGKRAQPALLNGNEPLLHAPPKSGAEIAPMLKQAITQSGMFYEAHQARWVNGEIPTAYLLQEPQGQLSSLALAPTKAEQPTSEPRESAKSGTTTPLSHNQTEAHHASAESTGTKNQTIAPSPAQGDLLRAGEPSLQQPASSGLIHNSLTPLVQQQLDALATQNFAWQGQIWPGQNLSWEIEENRDRQNSHETASLLRWRTRLKLTLPKLGEISAQLAFNQGGALDVFLSADSPQGQASLQDARAQLMQQLEQSGLALNSFSVQHASPE